MLGKIKEIYLKSYKILLAVPTILLVIAIVLLASQYIKTGDIMNKDISLKGGISATVYTENPADINKLESDLGKTFKEVSVRKLAEFGTDRQIGILVETSEADENKLKVALENLLGIGLTDENYSVEVTGSSLSASFYKQMIKALIFSFILMSAVVFIVFRTFIPSLTTIYAAFSDIVITLAVVNLLGLKISTAGIAALLLLVGYSIDTDILLTTRVIKRREGTIDERIFSSIKTGMTMSLTTLAASLVGYIVSESLVLKEMFLIISVGMIVDIIVTYLNNASILKIYAMKKERVV